MKALIDGDLIAYRCAASCENEEQHIAIARVNDLMERILARVNANSFTCYLSGGDNFRKEINKDYKAHRTQPKPKWLEACREHLVIQWKATITDGIEADDALGIAQSVGDNTIICSLDKDLLQVPGEHYQWDIQGKTAAGMPWSKEEQFHTISPEEGLKRFWTQMLVGDVADNIVGVYGIGPKKAAKILDQVVGDCLEELDQNYYNLVSSLYSDPIRMHTNAKCLWVLRSEGGIWMSPEERMKLDEERVDSGQSEELYYFCPESR